MALKSKTIGLGILFGAIVLINLYGLTQYPMLNCDEAVYANVSNNFLHKGYFGADVLGTVGGVDKNHMASGRIYHVGQAALIALLGYNLWVVRFFSVMGWLTAAVFVYFIGRKLSSSRVGTVSALIYLTSLNTLYISHIARAESWLVATTLGVAYYYLCIRDDPSLRQMIILGLVLPPLTVGIHVMNGMWFALALTMIVTADQIRLRQGRQMLLATGAAALISGTLLVLIMLLPDINDALYQITTLFKLISQGDPSQQQTIANPITTGTNWIVASFIRSLNGAVVVFSLYGVVSIIFLLRDNSKKMRYVFWFGGLSLFFYLIGTSHKAIHYNSLWDGLLALLIGEAILSVAPLISERLKHWFSVATPQVVSVSLALPLLLVNLAGWTYLSYKYHPRDYDYYISLIQEYIPPEASVMGEATLDIGFYDRNPFVSEWALYYGQYFERDLTFDATMVVQFIEDNHIDFVVYDGGMSCHENSQANKIYQTTVAQVCEESGQINYPWFGAYGSLIRGGPTIIYDCSE